MREPRGSHAMREPRGSHEGIQRHLEECKGISTNPKGHPGIWGREPRALSPAPWALTLGP
eukprot:1988893-Pyramimonas_sp.AAC.2